jgi:hypothetical protein
MGGSRSSSRSARRLRNSPAQVRQQPGPSRGRRAGWNAGRGDGAGVDVADIDVSMAPTGSQAPTVAVSTAACMVDTITVNGGQQPLLWDTHGGLAAMARTLLGLAAP